MIYDYYCIDCGMKMKGGDICFDLAELLGLRVQNNEQAFESRVTRVEPKLLDGFLRRNGKDGSSGMRNGVLCTIDVSLYDFLMIMAENEENLPLRNRIPDMTWHDLGNILDGLYTGHAMGEEKDEEVRGFVSVIQSRFVYQGAPEIEENRRRLDDFYASADLIPEFFENSDSIYSLQFQYDKRAVNMRKPGPHGEVRGYCPHCGKAIVRGAGKYPHTLIGLLGVQKSGKTSTIVAILEEIRQNYRNLGIKYPGVPLWNGRTADLNDNINLYKNGWAVNKTPVATSEGTFNATLLIEADADERQDPRSRQLITLVDIARGTVLRY